MEGAYLDVVPRDWSLPGLEAQRIMQPASDSDLGKCTNVFFIGMGPKITCSATYPVIMMRNRALNKTQQHEIISWRPCLPRLHLFHQIKLGWDLVLRVLLDTS